MSQQYTLPVTLPPALSQEPLKPVSPPADTQQEQVKQATPLPAPCQKMLSELPVEVPLEDAKKHTTLVKGVPEQECEPQPQEPQQQELHQQESQEQELHVDHHQQQQESQEQELHVDHQQQQQESQEQELHVDQQQQQQESQEQELHVDQQQQELQVQEVQQQQQQQQEQQEDHQKAEHLEQEEAQREQQLKGQLEQEKKGVDQHLDQELTKRDEHLEKKGEQLLEQQEKPLEPAEQQEGQLKQPVLIPAPGQVQETHPVQLLKGEVFNHPQYPRGPRKSRTNEERASGLTYLRSPAWVACLICEPAACPCPSVCLFDRAWGRGRGVIAQHPLPMSPVSASGARASIQGESDYSNSDCIPSIIAEPVSVTITQKINSGKPGTLYSLAFYPPSLTV
uniref:Involucrin n=1 Tax=Sus scrofa TaxID=9823 RepID=A0A8D1YFN2_PIG